MVEAPVTGNGKAAPLRIVLANGCFDLLHRGHIEHLREARAMGDALFIGLTVDEAVNKPGRPIIKWEDRATVLRELRCVTAVIPCDSGAQAILTARPQIFVKGPDYKELGVLPTEYAACREVGAEVAYTSAEKMSTTDIISLILTRREERNHSMWQRTSQSLPFKGEWLSVIHRISKAGEYIDQEAMWDGSFWTERHTGDKHSLDHYFLWRRYEV